MHHFRLFCAAIAIAALPHSGQTQSAPPLGLITAGDDAAARATADASSPVDRELVEALIDQRDGRITEAIAHLRTVLRLRPDHRLARRLLANALATDGQYEAAEYHFNRLLEDEPDPEARASYARALRAISARKPVGVTAALAVVPSTNINRGTANQVFPTDFGDVVIDEDNLGASGLGLALSAGAFHRFELPGGQRLQIDAKVATILYDKPQFNQHTLTLRGSLSDTTDGQSWSVAPEVSRAYLAGEAMYDRAAIALARGWTTSPRRGVILGALAEYRDYVTDDALSGPRFEVEARLRQQLTPRVRVETSLGLKRGDTQSAAFQYDGVEVGARLSRAYDSGLRLDVGATYEWRPYRGDFTGVTFAREDGIASVDFSVFNDKWTIQGAAPTYGCKLTWARSNIAFYDYSVQECTIGFTRNF